MLSLKRSINDYERLQCVSTATQELLTSTLESLKQFVVRTDAASVEEFRGRLGAIAERVRLCLEAQDNAGLGRSRGEIRGQLRDYHDRADRYIEHIRSELQNTSKALADLLTVCQAGTGAEQRLNLHVSEIRCLETALSLDDVRINARRIATSIAQCAQELKQEKDGIIVQLRDEIRTLQRAVEDAQRAARVGGATGCYTRQELERLIGREIVAGHPFVLVQIWLRNFEQLRDAFSAGVIDQLVAQFSNRVRDLANEAPLARWQSDVFSILTDGDARELGSDVLRNCAGTYECVRNEARQNLKVQVAVTHVVPGPEDDLDGFLLKIEKVNAKQRE